VFNIITTTTVRITGSLEDKYKTFQLVLPAASRWGLGSNLIGSPSNIAIKNNFKA
jgi:hypothetical protein